MTPTALEQLSQLAETELCQREPLELIKTGRLSIRTKSGDIRTFTPNFAQRIVLEKIEKAIVEKRPVRIRLLKARQLGFSTLFEAIIYSYTSRREGFHSLVIAHDEEGSKTLFEMNKLFHERLDNHLKPLLRKSNEIALEFEGLKSRIDIDTSRNKRAGRSHTYQIVHKSETAYFAFPKDVNLGIANAVPDLPETMIFDETTANGMNFHYDDVQRSIRCEDGFEFVFIAWFMNPEYSMQVFAGNGFTRDAEEVSIAEEALRRYKAVLTDGQLNWRRYAILHKCAGDKKLFCQEYPSNEEEAFLASGRPRFDLDLLQKLRRLAKAPLRQAGLVDVYKEHDPLHHYVIGADTSEGLLTGDKSSAIVVDTVTYGIVAELNAALAPDRFAQDLDALGRMYGTALIVVEDNNHGLATLNDLKRTYPKLYFRKTFDKLANEWKEAIGWRTTSRTKPLMIGELDKAIRAGLDIPSARVIEEMISYVIEEDGATNASEGKHDDRVMATACAIQGYLESAKEGAVPKRVLPRWSPAWADEASSIDMNRNKSLEDSW